MIDDQGDRRSIREINDKSVVDHICEGTINGMQKTCGSIRWYTDRQNGSFCFWLVNIEQRIICFNEHGSPLPGRIVWPPDV